MARNIQISAHDGGSFNAYLAEFEGKGEGKGKVPAIVIAHEIFGVTGSMREAADAFAAQGFMVAVPDIFWRQSPGLELDPSLEEDRNLGMSLLKGLDEPKAIADIKATAEFLQSLDNCNGAVAVVGYCMGGKLAYVAGIEQAYAAVSYYGVAIDSALDRAGDVNAPILLHLPEEDTLCKPEAQERIKSALGSNKHVSITTHPKVGHAFARKSSPAYIADAAEKADAETVAFLKSNLAS